MATAPFWFGQNAFSGTVTDAITALQSLSPGTQKCLVILWNDIKASLPDGTTEEPDTGEEWLAAITFFGLDKTLASLNSERRAAFSLGSPSIDQGFYVAGLNFVVRPVTLSFYTPSGIATRPGAADFS